MAAPQGIERFEPRKLSCETCFCQLLTSLHVNLLQALRGYSESPKPGRARP